MANPVKPARRSLQFHASSSPAGFSICYDNVQFAGHTKHQSSNTQSDFHLLTLAYATKHRVSAKKTLPSTSGQPAETLPPDILIPTSVDYEHFRLRMSIIVQRILVTFLPFLEELSKHILWHIPHAHSSEMSQKSEVVNMGVYDVNPSDTGDTISILDRFLKFIPIAGNQACPIPVHGDGLTVECIMKAKKARSLSMTPQHSFRSLLECAQEFHKEGLLLQVCVHTHTYILQNFQSKTFSL